MPATRDIDAAVLDVNDVDQRATRWEMELQKAVPDLTNSEREVFGKLAYHAMFHALCFRATPHKFCWVHDARNLADVVKKLGVAGTHFVIVDHAFNVITSALSTAPRTDLPLFQDFIAANEGAANEGNTSVEYEEDPDMPELIPNA